MKTKNYKISEIPVLSLLGFTRKEKEATMLAIRPLISAGVKFAVLLFDEDFELYMHNLTDQEQEGMKREIQEQYRLVVRDLNHEI